MLLLLCFLLLQCRGVFLESSKVGSITVASPESTTLVLNWLPPSSPNGDILNYTVRITLYSIGERISEENTTAISYTASNLSESYLSCSRVVLLYISSHTGVQHSNVPDYNDYFAGPGVPYNVSVIPVNFAGEGSISTSTYFTQELCMYARYT